MQAMKLRRSIMLGILLLGFGTGATPNECDAESIPSDAKPLVGRKPIDCSVRISENGGTGGCEPGASGPVSPAPAPECSAEVENPCMRYRIELVGDLMNVALRGEYIAAFGSACYLSEANTFDCWYRTWKKACEDAAKIGAVSGNAPYAPGYKCQPVGNGDYTLQIGPDIANITRIHFANAPRQMPLIDVNGVQTEVNGPYRNLTEPQVLGPGERFYNDIVDQNGNKIEQRKLILQINRQAHDDKQVHSDLAGFEYPCDGPGKPMCKEPLVLIEGSPYDSDAAEVHHVVRRKDQRCCPWGTNSNRNAVVISRKLNQFFLNKYPSADEVTWVNNIPAYTL